MNEKRQQKKSIKRSPQLTVVETEERAFGPVTFVMSLKFLVAFQEFFKQSDAEKLEGLPVTPFMDREKITKPSSQCSFIGFVLLPLFEALGELFTELQVSV